MTNQYFTEYNTTEKFGLIRWISEEVGFILSGSDLGCFIDKSGQILLAPHRVFEQEVKDLGGYIGGWMVAQYAQFELIWWQNETRGAVRLVVSPISWKFGWRETLSWKVLRFEMTRHVSDEELSRLFSGEEFVPERDHEARSAGLDILSRIRESIEGIRPEQISLDRTYFSSPGMDITEKTCFSWGNDSVIGLGPDSQIGTGLYWTVSYNGTVYERPDISNWDMILLLSELGFDVTNYKKGDDSKNKLTFSKQ